MAETVLFQRPESSPDHAATVYIIPDKWECKFTQVMEYNEDVKNLTKRIEAMIMKSLLIAGTFIFVK
jgi:hypothetical protein